MSGLVLPLPEPPDADADALLVQLRIARESLATARARSARVDEWAEEPDLAWPDAMTLGILGQVRSLEVALWSLEVVKLEQHARALGLRP